MNVEESVRGNAKGIITLHMRGLDIKNVGSGPLGLGRSDRSCMRLPKRMQTTTKESFDGEFADDYPLLLPVFFFLKLHCVSLIVPSSNERTPV